MFINKQGALLDGGALGEAQQRQQGTGGHRCFNRGTVFPGYGVDDAKATTTDVFCRDTTRKHVRDSFNISPVYEHLAGYR